MFRHNPDLQQAARELVDAKETLDAMHRAITSAEEKIIESKLTVAALREFKDIISHSQLDEAVKNVGNIRIKAVGAKGQYVGLREADQCFLPDGSFRQLDDNNIQLINEGRYSDDSLRNVHGIADDHSMRERIIIDALIFEIIPRLMVGDSARYLNMPDNNEDDNNEKLHLAIQKRKEYVMRQLGGVFNRVGQGMQMSKPGTLEFPDAFSKVLAAQIPEAQEEAEQLGGLLEMVNRDYESAVDVFNKAQKHFFAILSRQTEAFMDASDHGISPGDKDRLRELLTTHSDDVMFFFSHLLKEFAENGFIVAEGNHLIQNDRLIGSLNDQQASGDYLRLLAGMIKFGYANLFRLEDGDGQAKPTIQPCLDAQQQLIVKTALMVNTFETPGRNAEMFAAFRIPGRDKKYDLLPDKVEWSSPVAPRKGKREKAKEQLQKAARLFGRNRVDDPHQREEAVSQRMTRNSRKGSSNG